MSEEIDYDPMTWAALQFLRGEGEDREVSSSMDDEGLARVKARDTSAAAPASPSFPKHLWLRIFGAWFSGAIILSGLWMIDEILTLARYCGLLCLYGIPLIGNLDQYQAEGLAWGMILVGTLVLLMGWPGRRKQ